MRFRSVSAGEQHVSRGRLDHINRALRFSPRRSPSSRSVAIESAMPALAVYEPSSSQRLIVAFAERTRAGESTNRKRSVPARRVRGGAADTERKRPPRIVPPKGGRYVRGRPEGLHYYCLLKADTLRTAGLKALRMSAGLKACTTTAGAVGCGVTGATPASY